MRRWNSGLTALWLILIILSLSCSKDSKNSTGPSNNVEEKIEQTDTGIKHTIPPDTAAEVEIENELSISIPVDAFTSSDHPEGLIVTIDKIDDETSDTAIAMYAEETPFSPIYHVDAKDATFKKPVTLRVAVSNIDLPDDVSLSDVQIVTWQDSLTYEYLETKQSSDGNYLEADVTHFSYFAVKMKEGVSFAGGSNFELNYSLQISLDGDNLVFGNVFTDTNINVYSWLVQAYSMLRSSWINYQVEVFKDGFTNDALATMQIYRIAWYSSKWYEAEKRTDFHVEAGDLYGKNGYSINRRKEINTQGYDSLDGKERVIIFNSVENQISDEETYYDFESDLDAHGFLSQVFWSDKTSKFCEAAVLDDPDAKYFIRIKRAYSSGGLSSNTVTTDKFTPYDIPPIVTLNEPEAIGTVYTLTPQFSWSSTALKDVHVNHEIIISRYADPIANPQITIPMGSTYSLNEGSDKLTLEDGVAYYWCVRAYTSEDGDEVAETYSEVRTFLCAGEEEYTLTGRILENGSGLSGVSVNIKGTDVDETTTTDSDGYYTFADLPGITYSITPSLTDYSFEKSSLIVTVGEDTTADSIIATKSGNGGTPGGGDPHDIEGLTFVTIPGGTFEMGDIDGDGYSEEKPVHTVTVSTFEMSIYEVTNGQYATYLNEALASSDITASSSSVTGKTGDWNGQEYLELDSSYCEISYSSGSFIVDSGKENRPVVEVSWYGSKAFAEYYGLDLSREAEWEYASRGGSQYKYGTDDGTINSSNVNYNNNAGHTTDVGSYPDNPYGLYDMSGNVWEWCIDWYGDYSSGSVNDPEGPSSGSNRVVRGGSWYSNAGRCRSAARGRDFPSNSNYYIGFRVVRRP